MNPASNAVIMNGEGLARRMRERTAQRVEQIRLATGITPCLATVLVGDHAPSAVYVRMKRRGCEALKMRSLALELGVDVGTDRVVAEVKRLGADPAIHGILVQHPVPMPIDRRAVFEAIPLEKDVDGVTSATLGRLILGLPAFLPCTPGGIMRLIDEYKVPLEGADAVVVGRSPILGRPMASMLINRHATVTLCHSRTRNLPDITRRADLLIAAVGKPRFIQGDWIKPGAVVVDAGYNPGVIGDVDFESAVQRAGMITPVPGGVGPMTIATLLEQTAAGAGRQLGVDLP